MNDHECQPCSPFAPMVHQCVYCRAEILPKWIPRANYMKPCGSKFDSMVKIDWGLLWEAVGTMKPHRVECDDLEGVITVMSDSMGDLRLYLDVGQNPTSLIPSFRARTFGGGGRNERVRIALALLALAVTEDVEVKP